MLNKHYIRIDDQSRIVHGFSDSFEQPESTDIYTNEGGTQFELYVDGEFLTNPQLLNDGGVPLYKWDGKKALSRIKQEIEADMPPPPEPEPSEMEMRIAACEAAIKDIAEEVWG